MIRLLDIRPQVAEALAQRQAVVALESTAISHGLPWPHNIETAHAMQDVIRDEGAVPATIAISGGRIRVGLSDTELEHFARSPDIAKVSRRDLVTVLTQGRDGATTVAGTLACAALAGMSVFATGGIGGVHRGVQSTFDISADLPALTRHRIAVVCSGAKSILDLPKTLEVLETEGVAVVGYATDCFPAFHVRDSGLSVDCRIDDAKQAAGLIAANQEIGGAGLLIVNPVPQEAALGRAETEAWIAQALEQADAANIIGKDITPFMLDRLNVLSDGRTLRANTALLRNNARVAAQIAVAVAAADGDPAYRNAD